MTSAEGKHVFISYVKEDAEQIDQLCNLLKAAQIPYWRDRTALAPGDNWKAKIREAIRSGALVFLACFSDNSRARNKSVMNEELTLAVEEFRQMPPDVTWLIPVRLDDGAIPNWDLGAGRLLGDLQYVSLFGDQYATEAVALITAISRVMGTNNPDPATTLAAVDEATDNDRPELLRRLTKEMLPNPARRIELDDLIAQETKTVLSAMRDEDRFPTQRIEGADNNERIVHLAALATDYWKLIEPFCWSLQTAARWAPDAATLAPWTRALRAICAHSTEVKGGMGALLALRSIPAMVAIFTAGLACTGQPRWDNLRTLVVDTTITDPRMGRKIPLIEATYPGAQFTNSLLANVVARSAIHDEEPATALAAFTENKVGKYHTPVSEWLLHILRPMFDDQFPDDATYTNDFEIAEVMLGIIDQDQAIQLASDNPQRQAWARSSWFGRSTWRSRHREHHLVAEVAQQKLSDGTAWAPLQSSLFGGDSERADEAIRAYNELFNQAAHQHRF